MTYADASFDYYDDGLVHSHDWARASAPGGKHNEHAAKGKRSHDHDEAPELRQVRK